MRNLLPVVLVWDEATLQAIRATRPLAWASASSARAATGPRPTARSSGSTAPCSRNGPTPGCTAPTTSVIGPSLVGCGSTITADHTPHSTA